MIGHTSYAHLALNIPEYSYHKAKFEADMTGWEADDHDHRDIDGMVYFTADVSDDGVVQDVVVTGAEHMELSESEKLTLAYNIERYWDKIMYWEI